MAPMLPTKSRRLMGASVDQRTTTAVPPGWVLRCRELPFRKQLKVKINGGDGSSGPASREVLYGHTIYTEIIRTNPLNKVPRVPPSPRPRPPSTHTLLNIFYTVRFQPAPLLFPPNAGGPSQTISESTVPGSRHPRRATRMYPSDRAVRRGKVASSDHRPTVIQPSSNRHSTVRRFIRYVLCTAPTVPPFTHN